MGRELEEQREMLEVVDELADRVGGRLQTGMDKLKYVMTTQRGPVKQLLHRCSHRGADHTVGSPTNHMNVNESYAEGLSQQRRQDPLGNFF